MAVDVETNEVDAGTPAANRLAVVGETIGRPEFWAPASLSAVTAVIYLWALHINGWGNDFYAAAIQAGAHSWKAWFFGSSDWGNSITVDKPPVSLWIPGLSVRIFGLNSWAMLVPQALMGVASVWLLYLIVKKQFGITAGMIAGAALAATPVAALMFRFNNPDALLVSLMIASVWAMCTALESGRWRWLVLTGVFVGFGFLTKQLQVMLVVPPLALTYFAFGPRTWPIRLGQLFAALGAMVVSAGWWVLTVELWPKDSRPYIGGSKNNSILELTMGYNGLGRLTGNGESFGGRGRGHGGGMPPMPSGTSMQGMPGGGPRGGGGPFGGNTGWARMFDDAQGTQIAWLIPAALILVVAAIVLRGKAKRADPDRAQLVFWLLWGVTTTVVFSFMSGIFHPYYTIALAPAIAGGLGAGAMVCWRNRELWWARAAMAAASVLTGVTSLVLLNRTADYLPWLRWVVLIVAIGAGIALLVAQSVRFSVGAGAIALVAALLTPTVYTINTISHEKTGGIPTAGPSNSHGFGGFGGPRGPSGSRGDRGSGDQFRPGGFGGNATDPDVVALLKTDADQFVWAAATKGSMSASPLQLAVGHPIMPIGGFGGGDPSPTLAQFQQYVAQGKIHYFIDGGFGPGGGSDDELTMWIHDNFVSKTVKGVTLYDLTAKT